MDGTINGPDKKQIGRYLQMRRKQAGFKSAKAFAEYIGINPGTYTGYEQGRRSFDYEQAWQMADALDCTLDELGGREFDAGGASSLARDESALVEDYRRMADEDRAGFMATARGLAYAGDAKKAGDREPARVDAGDVR